MSGKLENLSNEGKTGFHARDDGRVSIGMQGSGKNGSKDRLPC